jgi:UDP-N-acetylmuramate--alanine ligase
MDGGATFIDDYAHLPNEIAAVLKASRDETDNWKRVVAVFQPNRFNRMNVLSPQYADSFVGADIVVITEIYASGTTPIEGVTGHLVVEAIRAAHPQASVVWQPARSDLIEFLANELSAGDLCISMGCGDIESLPDEVIAFRLAKRGVV